MSDWLAQELRDLARAGTMLSSGEILAILASLQQAIHAGSLLADQAEASIMARCVILAQSLQANRIEGMVRRQAAPESIRRARRANAAAYLNCWRLLREDCMSQSRATSTASRSAGEWMIWLRELVHRRYLAWLLWRLRLDAFWYRLGFQVNVEPELRRLRLALKGSSKHLYPIT